MITTFNLNTSELNINFIESIKKLFLDENIEITIKTTEKQSDFKEFTINEFNKRIAKSMHDSINENFTENNELMSEIKEWN